MHNQIIQNSKAEQIRLMELGFALGQNHTFGLVAGRCSAAQAQIIRKMREDKLYKECCEKWDDFCPTFLNVSRAEADRIIRLMDEFGPSYFELAQVIRISAGTFRAIAPAVSDGALHHNGEAIPLTPENSRKVAAAVAEMRGALPKKSAQPSRAAEDMKQQIQSLAERCVAMVAELDRTCVEHLVLTRIHLRDELISLRDQILRIAA